MSNGIIESATFSIPGGNAYKSPITAEQSGDMEIRYMKFSVLCLAVERIDATFAEVPYVLFRYLASSQGLILSFLNSKPASASQRSD